MTVCVRLFARAKDLASSDAVTLELPDGATVGELRQALAATYPALSGLLARSAVAVNDDFADDALTLPLEAEVAVLPPVSGGGVQGRPTGCHPWAWCDVPIDDGTD